MLKKLFLAVLVLSLVLAAGCGNSTLNGPVARVNGIEISRADFDAEVEAEIDGYVNQGYDLTDDDILMVEEYVLERLINNAMLLDAAEKSGITEGSVDIDGEIDEIKKQFEDEDEFLLALEEMEISLEEYRVLVAEYLIIEDFFKQELDLDNVQVSEEEIQELVDEFFSEYDGEDEDEDEDIDPEFVWNYFSDSLKEERINSLITDLIEELREDSEIEYLDNK